MWCQIEAKLYNVKKSKSYEGFSRFRLKEGLVIELEIDWEDISFRNRNETLVDLGWRRGILLARLYR